jgi:hypothetical protein
VIISHCERISTKIKIKWNAKIAENRLLNMFEDRFIAGQGQPVLIEKKAENE